MGVGEKIDEDPVVLGVLYSVILILIQHRLPGDKQKGVNKQTKRSNKRESE